MIVGHWAAELVIDLQDVLDLFLHPVDIGHLIEQTAHSTFSTGPVIADNVKDKSIIQLTLFFDGFDQSPDLCIGILGVPGKHLHLAGKQLLLIRSQLIPVLDGLGFGCQLRVLWYYTQSFLTGQGFFAQLVPPLVKSLPLYLAIHSLGTWCGA